MTANALINGIAVPPQPVVMTDPLSGIAHGNELPKRLRDNLGRAKVSLHQNIYEADFEYGTQPLRWENMLVGSGTITSQPGSGGVRMRITTTGDATIRQSRPYHRYQPGKTMFMATACNFGTANVGQTQRVGIFDDGNGMFFFQGDPSTANPYGMNVALRSDIGGVPVDTVVPLTAWSDPYKIAASLNWNLIQMLWIEFAWYGGGALRWGVYINGEPYILHEIGAGNLFSTPWCRTGNLPVRYEQRNVTSAVANDFYHYGVSVVVEGRVDTQRGFTYGYGMAAGVPTRAVPASATRYPLLSFRYRPMGTLEYGVDAVYGLAGAAIQAGATTTTLTVAGTPWTAGQWVGRYVFFRGTGSSGQGEMARITANTTNTLTYAQNIVGGPIGTAPAAGANYIIGMINRGQLLPQTLYVNCAAAVTLELIASTTTSPVVLTGATFNPLAGLGSLQSFAERDVSATALAGGEVVYNAPCPSGSLQQYDLTNFFALYNTIRGNAPDTLTVAITTPSGSTTNVGCSVICQEAMS